MMMLKEYIYQGQDDNNKAVLDTIAEKISRKNNSWRTRKSDTRRNTFAAQATHNLSEDEIRKR